MYEQLQCILQCVVEVLIPLGTVIQDVVVMHKQLLPCQHGLGGESAGDVAVDGVV